MSNTTTTPEFNQPAELHIETPTGSWFIHKFGDEFSSYPDGLPGVVFHVVGLLALVKDDGDKLYNYKGTVTNRM